MANRHKSRKSIIEILYAWSSSGFDDDMLPSLLSGRMELNDRRDQDTQYLQEAVYGITAGRVRLDETIARALKGRSLKSVGSIEINVLRLAAWELMNRQEIPYRVVINEALQLTHAYADAPARAFVNGVLDHLARDLRAGEQRVAGAGR